jgi:uncharacterized protein with HEPN domain
MRHRLIHAYFAINLDILWGTFEQDLPLLVATLHEVIAEFMSVAGEGC